MADEQGGAGGGPQGARKDRRTNPRIAVEMWVEEITDGAQVFRRAGNLSRGGMYLDQTIPIPIGSLVRLRFTLPDDNQPIEIAGTIVSVNPSAALGMGLKFTEVGPDAQSRIDAYLSRALTPVVT